MGGRDASNFCKPVPFLLRRESDIGQQFEFACSNCGYRATVSGGEDCGMMIDILEL